MTPIVYPAFCSSSPVQIADGYNANKTFLSVKDQHSANLLLCPIVRDFIDVLVLTTTRRRYS